jgi:glycosyltransferase involved in cell wall biosynthesis
LSARLHVGIIVPGFASSDDDWCNPWLTELARELGRLADIRVHALRYPYRADRYTAHGIGVRSYGGRQAAGLRRIPLTARTVYGVVQDVRRRQLDLLHAFFAHEPGALAALVGKWAGIPSVVTMLGGEISALPSIDYGGLLSATNRRLARFALTQSRHVIAACPQQARRLTALGWLGPAPEKSRLSVIPLGVDTTRFSPERPAYSGPPRLLSAGSLVPVKDHATLLDAFAKVLLGHPDATLTIAGGGPLRPNLESQAAERSLSRSVRFLGAVEYEDMPQLYRKADLLIVSSLSEGMSAVSLEAIASGCPIVGTRVGILDALPRCATTVETGDASALGDAISTLLFDAARLARMRTACVEDVQEYEITRVAQRIRATWLSLLASQARVT